MALRIVTWLVSLGVHAAFALAMFLPASGHQAAIEQGTGGDIMVVEQGLALEGVAKLGEDVISMEAVEAPPVQMAAAQPLPEQVTSEPVEMRPIEEQVVVASDEGPEQVNVKKPDEVEEIKPEELKELEPTPEEVTEKPPEKMEEVKPEEKKEQPLPPQVASVPIETVIAMRESSGAEKKGGNTNAHRAYLGKLRTHLESHKVNPRTTIIGTAVVQLEVSAEGQLVSHKIVKSSGSKVLDQAAMTSIERSVPFPPIPSNVGEDSIRVSVPFQFTVR